MPIKYTTGGQSNVFLDGGKNWSKFLEVAEAGYHHTSQGQSKSKLGLPDASNYFLKPKQYLVLVQKADKITDKTIDIKKNKEHLDLKKVSKIEQMAQKIRDVGQLTSKLQTESGVVDKKEFENNFGQIILIGKDWLELDIDQVPKSNGKLHYIFFEKKVHKVFLKASDCKNYKSEDFELAPHSWVWIYGGSLPSLALPKMDYDSLE